MYSAKVAALSHYFRSHPRRTTCTRRPLQGIPRRGNQPRGMAPFGNRRWHRVKSCGFDDVTGHPQELLSLHANTCAGALHPNRYTPLGQPSSSGRYLSQLSRRRATCDQAIQTQTEKKKKNGATAIGPPRHIIIDATMHPDAARASTRSIIAASSETTYTASPERQLPSPLEPGKPARPSSHTFTASVFTSSHLLRYMSAVFRAVMKQWEVASHTL